MVSDRSFSTELGAEAVCQQRLTADLVSHFPYDYSGIDLDAGVDNTFFVLTVIVRAFLQDPGTLVRRNTSITHFVTLS